MLKSLFRLFAPSKPFVSPTQKQLDYAALCGVAISNDMDREAVSNAIDAAFASDPKLKFKISARRKRKAKDIQVIADEMSAADKRTLKKWESAADEHDHFIVVYKSGRDTIVDILECDDVRFDTVAKMIVIEFFSPHIEEVLVGWEGKKEIRELELCWDQPLTLSTSEIIKSKKIKIFEDQVKKYQSAIERKLKELSE